MSGVSDQHFICLGASGSDGLHDLGAFLKVWPREVDAVLLMVLHRPIEYVSYLRSVLQRWSDIPIGIAEHGQVLVSGNCYIGEPDRHLTLGAQSRAHLIVDSSNAFRNRTIDILFMSVAEHAGSRCTGIVMSGSLSDGSRGLLAIKSAGGRVMARSPYSSTLSDMPRNAIRTIGTMDMIERPDALAAACLD